MSALPSEDIGERGEAWVHLFFVEWSWLPRKDDKDKGIDFNVEVPGELRRRFLVQVKTCDPITQLKTGDWCISVDKRALRKYQATREPVFVLGCDLPTKKLRALHIQKYIAQAEIDLGGDGQLTVRLAPEMSLEADSRDAFLLRVDKAWSYQNAQHFPATAAIAHMESELFESDSRFQLDVTATRSGYEIGIRTTEPIQFNVAVKPSSEQDAKNLEKALKFGMPSSIKYDELKSSDLPLLDRALALGGGILEIGGGDIRRFNLRLGKIKAKKPRNTLRSLLELRGEVSRGTHGTTIRSVDEEVPFEICARINFRNHEAEVDFGIHVEKLIGIPVVSLPYVKNLHELFAVGESGDLGLLVLRGDQPAAPPMRVQMSDPNEGRELMRSLKAYVGQLLDLIEVCRGHAPDRVLRSMADTSPEERHSWATGASLLKRCGVSLNTPGEFIVETGDVPTEVFSSQDGRYFLIKDGTYTVQGWGETICKLPVDVFLEGYETVPEPSSTAMLIRPGSGATAVMRLAAADSRAKRASGSRPNAAPKIERARRMR